MNNLAPTPISASSDVLLGDPVLPRVAHAARSNCLHHLFEAAAHKWPDAVAIEVPPGRSRPHRLLVTYAELDRRSRAIANRLTRIIAAECVVAIMLPRDSELLYAAQLGVLKAGAAWTCIDPALPDHRVSTLLADSEAVALLTDAAGQERVRGAIRAGAVLNAREILGCAAADHEVAPARWLGPSSLAYVIYTSGTTGSPKGTLIEHGAIVNLVRSDLAEFGLGPGDRVAQNSSPSYDSSVEETWLALAAGATLVVMDDDAVRLGPDLPAWLRRERVTVFCPTPTLLRATGSRYPERDLPDLRLVYVGGEALPRDVAERWARGRRLENGYGPTECAVTALRTWIHPGAEVSIGKPVPGISAWVLDESLQEVPDGQPGELCLGGAGLARGYHRRPELTARQFPEHPTLGRIYRTGDLAHRTAGGVFHVHGRLDAQVKLRGHRVELEEVEACLTSCAGVREAACRLQEGGAAPVLVAFVVPSNGVLPDEEALRRQIAATLPAHMVPARIATLAALPTTVGGKLDRRSLPTVDLDVHNDGRSTVAPRNASEARIVAAFAEALKLNAPPSATADFFVDLGGDSLSAAMAVFTLQDEPATAAITVRDLYDNPSAAALAMLAAEPSAKGDEGSRPPEQRRQARRPVAATLFQGAWLFMDFVVASLFSYVVLFHVTPAVAERIGVGSLLLLLPLLGLVGLAAYAVAAVACAAWVKRRLIGRYQPMRVPVWGRQWLKHWVVSRAAARIPWWLLEGTEYQKMALRALGARIGERVHIHRGVDLSEGGWDLLEIGDDVTLSQGASVRLVELEAGDLIVGPVVLESGCTLDVNAGVRTDCRVERHACLTAHSSLARGGRIPRGECWDGIPARPAGHAPPVPPVVPGRRFSPRAAGDLLLLTRLALVMFLALPSELLALAVWWAFAGSEISTASAAAMFFDARTAVIMCGLGVVAVPLTLLMAAIACRVMVRERQLVVSRWSAAYVPLWLVPDLVDSAQRWLYGTLFWPHWLRLAGARIGRDCEISSLIDALPATIDIGDRSFCADGIYLGGARIHRGAVTVRPVALASNIFLGNGALVPGGVRVPEGTLLGINTVADSRVLRPHTAWFGHPAFRLRGRQAVATDTRPTLLHRATRLFWETARFSLPIVPVLAFVVYLWGVERLTSAGSVLQLAIGVPLITLGTALIPIVAALATKWLLLGRMRPGAYPLWSSWVSRWDFFCVVWNVYVRELAAALRSTALLPALLRAAGARIGRGVVLDGRFAEDLPDPDMITIEDGATVEGTFQAHTFEDRVLKNGPVVIRAGATVAHNAVLLYGAEVGAGTRVGPHSVIMKHERLLAGIDYEGFPIRRVVEEESR